MRKVLYTLLVYVYCTIAITASSDLKAIDISSSHQTIGKYTSVYEDPTSYLAVSDSPDSPADTNAYWKNRFEAK